MVGRESSVLFYNVSKKSNVGPIVRSAGAFGVSRILLVGDTRSKVKFGAQGTHTRIPIEVWLSSLRRSCRLSFPSITPA
jgi:tRNA G18 (ribose-2'-O)-methylase SpoU